MALAHAEQYKIGKKADFIEPTRDHCPLLYGICVQQRSLKLVKRGSPTVSAISM